MQSGPNNSGDDSGEEGIFAEINVTPLTDVFLVLLAASGSAEPKYRSKMRACASGDCLRRSPIQQVTASASSAIAVCPVARGRDPGPATGPALPGATA